MDHTDMEYEYLDGLNYLKERYPSSINPAIETLLFCQDADAVWIEVVFSESTPLGVLRKKETINLEYIVEQYSLWEDVPLYTPEKSIMENAVRFFEDANTLYQTTSILVNDCDLPEVEDEEERVNLSECEEMNEIILFVQELFRIYDAQPEVDKRDLLKDYRNYVVSSIEGFIAGDELKEFSFSLLLEQKDEKLWISVYTDGEAITLSEEGYVYTPGVGGDTYSSWMFTIWSSGDTDGSLNVDIDKASEMINLGAKIQIETPDEYVLTDEDDDE